MHLRIFKRYRRLKNCFKEIITYVSINIEPLRSIKQEKFKESSILLIYSIFTKKNNSKEKKINFYKQIRVKMCLISY